VERGQDERVERSVEGRDVLLEAEEERLAHDAQVVRPSLDRGPLGPVTDETEAGVDAELAQAPEGEQHVLSSLHSRHPADPADDEPLGFDAEDSAALGPLLRVCSDAFIKLDPETDDGESSAGRDAQLHEVVTDLRADGDEGGRAAREPTLEQAEGGRLRAAEVPAQ